MLLEEFALFEVDSLCYSAKNLCEMLKNRGLLATSNYITSTLQSKYGLESKNSSYKWYRSEIYGSGNPLVTGFTNAKGRYFEFTKELFEKEC